MPSYLVTGASRGLGYAFVKSFAAGSDNTVIGIVRDKVATEKKLAQDGVKNVHVYQADITDLPTLKAAAADIQVQCGAVDYLICNAAHISQITVLRDLGEFEEDPEILEQDLQLSFRVNVIGLINTINAFLPLVRAGSVKKILAVTSGMGDCTFINDSGMAVGSATSISKAGVNMVVAKYNAMLKDEGVLVMGICPGSVDTNTVSTETFTEKDMAKMQGLVGLLFAYNPHFAGQVSPEEAASRLMKIGYAASLDAGCGGTCVPSTGTDRWL